MIRKELFLNKRFIITGLLVLFSLIFLGVFTQSEKVNPIFQTLLVSVTFFLVVPVLYSKMILKESLKNLGWQSGNFFSGMFVSIVCVALALGAVVLFSRFSSFSEHYLLPASVETSFLWFMVYELVFVTFTALLYEIFFRGLIQLLWLQSFPFLAIFFQAALFIVLFSMSDDLTWQRLPILLFSPLAGIIAYYSQSVWYSWAASWTFFFLTDVFLLTLR